jgi:dTMP kinase
MANTGKLIAIEGIDGSGKRTQVELLANTLTNRGYSVFSTGFPQYGSTFGKLVGQFLNGDFGPLDSLDPHLTALLYAGDRFQSKPALENALRNCQIVLADRYIASNLAHQTARAAAEKRSEFITWIEHLEYNIYGLPRESLILYLRVPPAQAQALVSQKSARTYTSAKQDIQESNLRHLEDAAAMYDQLAKRSPWATIQCFDTLRHVMRSPEEISADILTAVEPILAAYSIPEAR